MLQDNDASLVKQTLEGNRQAFDDLVVKYNTSIYKLILSWISNPEDALELTQEVFIDAYKELSSLREPEKFYYWLRRIAVNRCQNWKRRLGITHIPLDDRIVSEEPSPEEVIIIKETLAKMIDIINRLPEPDRNLIEERYLENNPYYSLARRYGVSSNTLAVRLVRIKQKIRDQLKELLVTFPISSYWKLIRKIGFEDIIGVMTVMKAALMKELVIWTTVVVFVLCGSGFLLWEHFQKPVKISNTQSISAIEMSSAVKNRESLSRNAKSSMRGLVSISNDFKEKMGKQNENAKDAKTIAPMNLLKDEDAQQVKEPEKKETPLQKYLNIINSPEYKMEYERVVAPYEDDFLSWEGKAKALYQRKQELESILADASSEKRDKIQKELEKVGVEYKEARIRAAESMILMISSSDSVNLKYFTPDEFHEAIFQLGTSGMIASYTGPLPTKEQGEVSEIFTTHEDFVEAEKRLNARGINTRLMPPPPEHLLVKYTVFKNGQ